MHVGRGSTVAGAQEAKRKYKVKGEVIPMCVFILVNALPIY